MRLYVVLKSGRTHIAYSIISGKNMTMNPGLRNRIIKGFDLFVIIVASFACIEIPVLFAFNVPIRGWTLAFEIVVFLVFVLDIFRNMFFVHDVSARWKTNKNPALEYIKGWFWIDLLAAIPFTLILACILPADSQPHAVIALYLVRSLKFLRVMQLVRKVAQFFALNPSVMRLALMFVWVLVIAHYIACIWSYLGYREDSFTTDFQIYLRAYYFTTTTIATVGYGDISPKTMPQTAFVIFVELVGAGIYGFVIGNIANVIASIDIAKTQFREKQDRVDTFMKYRNIPSDLQGRILEYYAYLWESRRGHDEATVLQDLPINLKTKLSIFLNKDLIEKVPLFHGASSDLIRDIILKLEPIIFMPGDIIVEKGEMGYEMFFISRGSVDVVSEDGKIVYATLATGQFFGEIALLLSSPRTATIKARDYCDLYKLDKDSFDTILQKHQDFALKIRELAEQRRAELNPESTPDKKDESACIRTNDEPAGDHYIIDGESAEAEPLLTLDELTNLTVSVHDGVVVLQWDSYPEYNHYEIIKKIAPKRWKMLNSSIIENKYTDRNPLAGDNCYRVRVVTLDGPGKWSDQVVVRV